MSKEIKAAQLISQFEGCKLKAYLDSAGIWTIGIGTIIYPNGVVVKEHDTCTAEQANEYLIHHLEKQVFPAVNKLINNQTVPDNVYAALSSFAYNCGTKYFKLEEYGFIDAVKTKNWGTFDLNKMYAAATEKNWVEYDRLNQLATGLSKCFLRYYKKRTKEGNKVPERGLAYRRCKEANSFYDKK
jgi:GH24 family phage-related lysozyme (muramidase)